MKSFVNNIGKAAKGIHKSQKYFVAALIISIFLVNVNNSFASILGKYYITKDSKIWVEGTSTVDDFSCFTYLVNGEAMLDSVPLMARIDNWKDASTKYFADAFFNVKTKTLDCGKKMMNEDMYDALKAEKFAFISFKVENVSLLSFDKTGKKSTVLVKGSLSIAGKTKPINLEATISTIETDLRYRVQSSVKLNMKDFDIKPPQALFGLIKANENITLFIDLKVASDLYSKK